MAGCGHLKAEMQRNVFPNALDRLWKGDVRTESAVNQQCPK